MLWAKVGLQKGHDCFPPCRKKKGVVANQILFIFHLHFSTRAKSISHPSSHLRSPRKTRRSEPHIHKSRLFLAKARPKSIRLAPQTWAASSTHLPTYLLPIYFLVFPFALPTQPSPLSFPLHTPFSRQLQHQSLQLSQCAPPSAPARPARSSPARA